MKNYKLMTVMKNKRLTQLQLANALGLTQGMVGHLITRRRKTSIEIAIKMAEYFGRPVLEIFDEDDITNFFFLKSVSEKNSFGGFLPRITVQTSYALH